MYPATTYNTTTTPGDIKGSSDYKFVDPMINVIQDFSCPSSNHVEPNDEGSLHVAFEDHESKEFETFKVC